MRKHALIGSPAVFFELPDAYGRLHDYRHAKDRWLLLVFLRHLG